MLGTSQKNLWKPILSWHHPNLFPEQLSHLRSSPGWHRPKGLALWTLSRPIGRTCTWRGRWGSGPFVGLQSCNIFAIGPSVVVTKGSYGQFVHETNSWEFPNLTCRPHPQMFRVWPWCTPLLRWVRLSQLWLKLRFPNPQVCWSLVIFVYQKPSHMEVSTKMVHPMTQDYFFFRGKTHLSHLEIWDDLGVPPWLRKASYGCVWK